MVRNTQLCSFLFLCQITVRLRKGLDSNGYHAVREHSWTKRRSLCGRRFQHTLESRPRKTSEAQFAGQALLVGVEVHNRTRCSRYLFGLCLPWATSVWKKKWCTGRQQEKAPIYALRNSEKTERVRSFVRRCDNDGVIPRMPRCVGDRFIPRRQGQKLDEAYQYLEPVPPEKTTDGHCIELPKDVRSISNGIRRDWEKRDMVRALATVFPGAGGRRRLLKQFGTTCSRGTGYSSGGEDTIPGSFVGLPKNFADERYSTTVDDYRWPVKPRRRPVIGRPDRILDVPQFRTMEYWSSKNLIATVIGRSVCVIRDRLDEDACDIKIEFYSNCTAVKFSNSGDKLAIGRDSNCITSVFSHYTAKYASEFKCDDQLHPVRYFCRPTAYAWSNDDKYLIAGCSGGSLEIVDVVTFLKKRKLIPTPDRIVPVVGISFSPNNRFLTVTSLGGFTTIYSWPGLDVYMQIVTSSNCLTSAWHPWKGSLLCLGGMDGSLTMCDIQSRLPHSFNTTRFRSSVDNLAWNKITGELVVNWFVREHERRESAVIVYANFDFITDVITPTANRSRVGHMLWSPDGATIACQAQQSIFMYGFLDKSRKERMEKEKRLERDRRRRSTGLSYFNLR
ncbi:protein cortex isoform X3 [Athalia rosae]|uniref:protein cortex isoform X3 n=1 Tax=Athalia rosae TaxID=37344 RepID=UPI002034A065|nr:protein cortex isoform X3 [Athalia rosae]